MKNLNDIIGSKKVLISQLTHDGMRGTIQIRGWKGTVVVSTGAGWDHISVSPLKSNYTPTWDDMCAIKDIFFYEEEAVIQIHPPKSEYVNEKKNCLHLWRANDKDMILPPYWMVGPKEGQTKEDAIREAMQYYKDNGYKW
jgi:hypothetical protein